MNIFGYAKYCSSLVSFKETKDLKEKLLMAAASKEGKISDRSDPLNNSTKRKASLRAEAFVKSVACNCSQYTVLNKRYINGKLIGFSSDRKLWLA